MKKFWTSVLVAGFAATVGVSAQGAPQAPQAPGPPGGGAQSQASTGKTVTLSGCIQAAESPAGAAAQQASAPAFVLAVKPGAGQSAQGAVGTAGSAAMQYRLEGEETAIKPHLNHQVEITGTVDGAAARGGAPGAPGAGAQADAGAQGQAGAGRPMGPTLKVESVKMVSATCS